MIIVLKPNCPEEQVKKFTDSLTQEYNVKVNTCLLYTSRCV